MTADETRRSDHAGPGGSNAGLGRTPADGDDDGPAADLAGGALVIRLLRGDQTAMTGLVMALGAGNPDEMARWGRSIGALLEAIVGRAIDEGFVDFPPDHPFWDGFDRDQGRGIVRAFASLGHRFDGMGGWLDDRVPTHRELSLALGYAGLDPVRLRHGPPDTEAIARLYDGLRVAADEYLVGVAGGLALSEVVTMVGPRADALADVWADWPRVRRLLLATS